MQNYEAKLAIMNKFKGQNFNYSRANLHFMQKIDGLNCNFKIIEGLNCNYEKIWGQKHYFSKVFAITQIIF